MKVLLYADDDYVANEEGDKFLCPQCHGEIYHDVRSNIGDRLQFAWFCHSCIQEYEPYELKVIIKEIV